MADLVFNRGRIIKCLMVGGGKHKQTIKIIHSYSLNIPSQNNSIKKYKIL